ncbi:AraC family transcriptional regulator [Mucilaginibacter pedocola]|uniref:HTH araC/xylS-type domain-containing protein n=1 Tax=Mucilaginibacter pedocola TaxID=1792845 RepID=A0A1S9P807_9SPHI|nr:AraC family transcriptional regulator [Mucilaginibacter pedocola]OOQ56977.1 hypothetical protein BC343_15665 [Mucilaginibacter pedocola]
MLTITHSISADTIFNASPYQMQGNNEPVITLRESKLGGSVINIKAMQIADVSAFSIEVDIEDEIPLDMQLGEAALIMCFTLSGSLTISGHIRGSFSLRERSHFVFPTAEGSGATLGISGKAKLFVACFYGDVLPKLFSSGEQQVLRSRLSGNAWRAGRQVTLPMTDIITTLLQRADNNSLHQLFMAAKMLELLFISMEQLKQVGTEQPSPIKTKDLEKLEQAKLIIKQNLRQPYSLIELAHKVGLNDFKLKKGFREAYGNTVFGYLLDVRMRRAVAMLSSGNYKVSEVAHEVGYKNAHHFSDAFKRKLGYLPSKHPVV